MAAEPADEDWRRSHGYIGDQEEEITAEKAEWRKRAQRRGFAFADLQTVVIDQRALDTLPGEMVVRLGLLPIRRDGKYLWAATTDPTDAAALAEAGEASGRRIIPVLAMPGELEAAILLYYGPSS